MMSELVQRQPAEPVRNEDGSIENFMPRINGEPFRCECRSNVFHKPDRKYPSLYECNGCGVRYRGA